jgi:peptidoglycan/xylan/chitin deacetylase (PgdA/CDA1 family)
MKNIIYFLLIFIFLTASGCHSITRVKPEIDTNINKVILSFDDGPNADGDTTARLLDVLKKYNIRAMFALIGVNAEKNPELVRRIYEEGHIIINHGYSDIFAHKMNKEEFRNNLSLGETAIAAALDKTPDYRLYRPQGGYYYQWQEDMWRAQGWTMISGNIRAWDAVKTESEKQNVTNKIIKKTGKKDGGIILLHDAKNSWFRMETALASHPAGTYNRRWIPDIVEKIIITLLEKGYQL